MNGRAPANFREPYTGPWAFGEMHSYDMLIS